MEKITPQLAMMRRNRKEWFDKNGPCVICGSDNQLEMDHIDPSTKHYKLKPGPGKQILWSWSRERREEELAKCQVLCVECHRKKTKLEYQKPFCKNGHAMVGDNVGSYIGRERLCLQCRRDISTRRVKELSIRRAGIRAIKKAPTLVVFS